MDFSYNLPFLWNLATEMKSAVRVLLSRPDFQYLNGMLFTANVSKHESRIKKIKNWKDEATKTLKKVN